MDQTLIGGRYRPVERTGTDDRVARWIAFDEQTGELLAIIVSLRPLNAGSREEIWFRGLAPAIGARYDSAAGVIVDHLTEDEIDGRAAAAPRADRGPAPILRPATPVGRAIVRPVPIRQAVPLAVRPTAARPVAWPPAPPAETRTAPAARSDVAAAQQAVRAEIDARRTAPPAAAPTAPSPERLRVREAAIAPDRRTGAARTSAAARTARRPQARRARTLLLPAGAVAGGLAVVLGASVLLLAPPAPADPSASGIAHATTFVVRPTAPADPGDRAGDPVAGGRPVAQVGGFLAGTSAPGDPAATPAPRRVAPAVIGLPLSQALTLAEKAGLVVATTERRLAGTKPGTVVGQDPAAGTRLPVGATFRLAVAAADAPGEPAAPAVATPLPTAAPTPPPVVTAPPATPAPVVTAAPPAPTARPATPRPVVTPRPATPPPATFGPATPPPAPTARPATPPPATFGPATPPPAATTRPATPRPVTTPRPATPVPTARPATPRPVVTPAPTVAPVRTVAPAATPASTPVPTPVATPRPTPSPTPAWSGPARGTGRVEGIVRVDRNDDGDGTDPGEGAVVGAIVRVEGCGPVREMRTWFSGIFRYRDLPPGPCRFTVLAKGLEFAGARLELPGDPKLVKQPFRIAMTDGRWVGITIRMVPRD